ncbi:hypothetical protein HanIR_Chr11g0542831 [Helianthus annuus]|nr:hypothetical protein HanIR_Chr11g0542831 [Helianthus annuus]
MDKKEDIFLELTISPPTQCTLYTTLGAVVIKVRLYSRSSLSCAIKTVISMKTKTIIMS